jgi:penicillin G amidase
METVRKLDQEKHPGRRWKKAVWMTVGIIVLLLVTAVIFVNAYTLKSLPETSGEAQMDGLSAPVTITRDEEGVPHIKAENEMDLFMAQGYVQAQDRLFQMELARRQASGRLSEVVGEATVDQDRYFRTLGLRKAAEQSLAIYSNETVDRLQAFADGINAFMEKEPLPAEFSMMAIDPEPWPPLIP